MEEAIVVVRALSGGGGPVTYEGEFYRVDGLVPARVPTPPIWTGSVAPKSLAVTGRRADGWIPGHAADWLSQRYATSRPIIDEAATAAGRDPAEVATIYNLPGRITASPLRATRDAGGRWIGGSVEQWVAELTGAVLAHGAGASSSSRCTTAPHWTPRSAVGRGRSRRRYGRQSPGEGS
ncbi:hypothetical protein Pflav_022120 [Phytohabitans flavus]|uniref:Luciferase-like domain-containing protein n=1 Tax=Phytohabitans flavus TaxID=1076124 RepID=A0A6F8XPN3_9ACTN|nr:hypothetical protein Pflav_022120 [Phytohabitans flavus]